MDKKTLKRLLIITIILAVVEFLRTNTINGVCLLPVFPLLIMLDQSEWDKWAQKKQEEMSTPEERIRDLILSERERQGMTYRELSIRADISIQSIFHWKQGGGMTIDVADRALRALGLSVTLGEEGEDEDE